MNLPFHTITWNSPLYGTLLLHFFDKYFSFELVCTDLSKKRLFLSHQLYFCLIFTFKDELISISTWFQLIFKIYLLFPDLINYLFLSIFLRADLNYYKLDLFTFEYNYDKFALKINWNRINFIFRWIFEILLEKRR